MLATKKIISKRLQLSPRCKRAIDENIEYKRSSVVMKIGKNKAIFTINQSAIVETTHTSGADGQGPDYIFNWECENTTGIAIWK